MLSCCMLQQQHACRTFSNVALGHRQTLMVSLAMFNMLQLAMHLLLMTGLARHSDELLPVSVSMTQRNAVSSLSSAEWNEKLREKWNGDLLVFAPPSAETNENGNSKAYMQLGLARLGGILRFPAVIIVICYYYYY